MTENLKTKALESFLRPRTCLEQPFSGTDFA